MSPSSTSILPNTGVRSTATDWNGVRPLKYVSSIACACSSVGANCSVYH